eukprot:3989286-Pleurochrysis_carterae.AAC.1
MHLFMCPHRIMSSVASRTLAQVTTPIVQLLRLMDSEKPAMGKIYDRMFNIGERIRGINVDWSKKAADIHAERWEYLHSPFHAVGYALDP